jgi:Spy/CpxP family protein refolding chaperone
VEVGREDPSRLGSAGRLTGVQRVRRRRVFQGRVRLFADQLNLDAKQKAVFETMLARAAAERAESRKARLPRERSFLAELARERPDEQALLDYADQDPDRDYRRTITLMMRDFMAVLTPKQKQVFIHAMEQRAASNT